MQVIERLSDWQVLRQQITDESSVGFIPTMGNLHKGHGQLIEQSIRENDHTIVSIFVNDKQFNDPSDFANYPRTINEDIRFLQQIGVDYCLMPSADELYADGYLFQVVSQAEQNRCEDQYRPGHFTGVLTVVMKLLQLVRPQRAYFGEKDYQQLRLIGSMVKAFFMPVQIIGVATLREKDGLPFSSRNKRLSVQGRQKASEFAAVFAKQTSLDEIKARLQSYKIQIEYIEEIDNRRLIAVIIDGIRLIDNRVIPGGG